MARGFLGFTRDDVTPSEYQRLWMSVLGQAVLDAFNPQLIHKHGNARGNPVSQRLLDAALDYLLSEDCAIACGFAGYDPDVVMPRLADLVKRHRAGEKIIMQYGPGYKIEGNVVSLRPTYTGPRKRKAA